MNKQEIKEYMDMTNAEQIVFLENRLNVLRETLKIAEQIQNEGLLLKRTGKNRFSVSRDYNRLSSNTKLKRLSRRI